MLVYRYVTYRFVPYIGVNRELPSHKRKLIVFVVKYISPKLYLIGTMPHFLGFRRGSDLGIEF